jgi:hypothetical protein
MKSGYQHTLTVWDSRTSMLDFMRSGAHLSAMKLFRKIATGKSVVFDSDGLVSWKKALEIWDSRAKEH